jgi:formylglycine-generating enzyme required for sulfatase activity
MLLGLWGASFGVVARAGDVFDAARVYIAPGWFDMGSSDEDVLFARQLCVSQRQPQALQLRGCASEELFSNEVPVRRVFVSAYFIDRYEVSRAEYADCVRQGGCAPALLDIGHPGIVGDSKPISGVSFAQAEAYCAFRGGRLPTEAEWERAARGDSARRFPWGKVYNPALENHGIPAMTLDPTEGEPSREDGHVYTAPVRAFEASHSPHGLVQMAGNVREWTQDGYAPLSLQATRVDPLAPRGNGLRVVRGGSFRSPAFALRVTHREARSEASAWVDVGMRCVYESLSSP